MDGQVSGGVTAAEIADAIRGVGITAGDHVILHSSFKSLGPVAGGPDAVIDAVLSVIGPRANLLVPTFTYCLPIWRVEPFDIARTRARVGVVPETLRQRPDARRSFHPTHSVAVIGPDAESLIRNHLHATPIGLDSPFGRMRGLNAKILMLGTCQDTNSPLHLCEVAAALPYIQVCFSAGQTFELAWFLNESGQVEYTQIFEVPGCSRGFRIVEGPLRQLGVLKDVEICAARSQLIGLNDLVSAMCELLRKDPSLLLCDTQTCGICPKRRAHMKKSQGAP
jgi:aminoglycoside 3-N-acetyltransferase